MVSDLRSRWAISTLAVLALASLSWGSVTAFQGQAPDRVDVLITFRSAAGPGDDVLVENLGGRVKYRYQLVPGMAANLPQAAVTALLNSPRVTAVEPDGLVFADDAELDLAWGVKRIEAGDVHDISGITGTGVKVAVLDSGIDMTHPDLVANFVDGYDFVNNDAVPFDDNGHGTHVSGTIAAIDNDAGVVGVAPGASLYAYKVLNASGSGNWSDVIAALDQAVADGIQVTNNSYGAGSDPGSLVQAAFDESAALGILHVASAGNSGKCVLRGNSVGYPARYASVVAVAATNQDDGRPCFSSSGPDVELAAPGVSIPSTYPGGLYASMSGTSMASPHVAGVAALVMSAGVASADDVRSLLTATAIDLGSAGRDTAFGYGLVDALAAVTAAAAGPGPGPDPDPDPDPSTVSVSAVDYAMTGGRSNDKHLQIIVTIIDGAGAPVGGASVSIAVSLEGSAYGSGSGATGTNGQVVFEIKNAPSGCYTTTVTDVASAGATWDGTVPANQLCK